MKLGIIGLGKMGFNMARRLLNDGHEVVAFDLSEDAVQQIEQDGATGLESLGQMPGQVDSPAIIWMMIPQGDPVDDTINVLLPELSGGDILIDGGNSNYKDTLRRGDILEKHKIHYVDVGTSGGVWGLEEGYSMMIGGDRDVVNYLTPVFESLAPDREKGWGYVGKTGAGHFVKMVHNGIEYGMMQAYAEGFSVLEHKEEFDLDLHNVAEIWRFGSVIRSWLLDLTSEALRENPTMDGIAPYVSDSGEGRWTVQEAIDLDVSAPIITGALLERLRSRDSDSFTDKLLASMRNQFGGHSVKKEEE